MAGGGLSPTSDKASIKYRYLPHEGAFFDLADVERDDYTPSSSTNNKENSKKSEPKSQDILTTSELISIVGQIWDSATRPLALFQRKRTSNYDNADLQKGNNILCYPKGQEIVSPSVSGEGQFFSINSKTHNSSTCEEDLESPKVTQNIPIFQPYNSHCTYSPIWRCLKGSSVIPIEPFGVNVLVSEGISSDLRDVYAWMNELTSTQIGDRKIDDCNITQDTSNPLSYCNNKSGTSAYDESLHKSIEVDTHESQKNQEPGFVGKEKYTSETSSLAKEKSHSILAKQEHAFAGAFAGIFVSVCLHPVDTVKTVIQSCQSDQKSVHHISRSIISERGVTGLYRGIASNITSSAPISAIYTFTYESVKGALLPVFAKEYHSLAHCIAGGCASIATSFIFTPSECIKQQMQVRSHYQNCWSALIGIVKKGGFSSLYAGWGAVLCRNVPHSIIKFYTYESLKQFMLSSFQSNPQPNTLLTLVCGGLAGSTAALFTTPFDVVKTRLQTQIPGSINQYDGVLTTLKEIAKHEGLKGLYRGLTPRLVMYMTQGALFFASYESFKRLFSIEPVNLNAQQKVQEESASLSNDA